MFVHNIKTPMHPKENTDLVKSNIRSLFFDVEFSLKQATLENKYPTDVVRTVISPAKAYVKSFDWFSLLYVFIMCIILIFLF